LRGAIDDPNRHPEACEPKGQNESRRAAADDENWGVVSADDVIHRTGIHHLMWSAAIA